ncbi:BQ5605_C003g02346 [Microbotryum silenes-dioicae]|uniref:BQ5605_C003g02346 protein n=1 Tax=Microbotryum silenes-dioicae TaxID=796604 RepID=A0A2X0NYM8_9BASI|nr:BQ5605_C003g02346 [Microbotryum silenes-dioicae]
MVANDGASEGRPARNDAHTDSEGSVESRVDMTQGTCWSGLPQTEVWHVGRGRGSRAHGYVVGSGGPEKEFTGQPIMRRRSIGPVIRSSLPYDMLLVAEGQLHLIYMLITEEGMKKVDINAE